MNHKKLLMITPHLSTGGLPQVFLKKVENLKNYYDLIVIEYQDITAGIFTVQKNRLKSILPTDKFITLGGNKNELLSIIDKFNPDYIHLEEVPENFMEYEIAKSIYKNDRQYFITETTHNVLFDISGKKFFPDKFMHVSQFIADKFEPLNVPYEIIEYPIEKKDRPDRNEKLKELGLDPEYKHVLNVGLFTPGKNQKQVIEIARLMEDEKIQFHFVGNQAGNFQDYWEPLMKDLPSNCKIWGERNDVDNFYSSMDLFLFTSTYELNPIVIKEALSYDMKIMMYNLEPYAGVYNNNPNITFLGNHNLDNVEMLKNILFDNKNNLLPKKCYVTHTTKNYRTTTFGLIESILEYSQYPIVVFTVNFNINEVTNPFKGNENVIFFEMKNDFLPDEAKMLDTEHGKYVDRTVQQTYKILSVKAKALLKAFDMGVVEGVYLDSDSVVRYNVDDLMKYTKDVKGYPLLTRGVYDFILGPEGQYDVERPMMDYFGVKERSMPYVQSNIVVFTNECRQFMEDWKEMCDDETVLKNFKEWAPMQDETVVNVLLWKEGCKNHLPMHHFNIRNLRFVEEFDKFDDTDKSKYSEQMQGFKFYIDGKQMDWSYIPYNKEDVKVFHGIKQYDEMQKIIKFMNRVKKKFCIIQTCDENYEKLSDITYKNNKEYCDLHGYDYISYKQNINNDKSAHWQKYLALKRHLRNYEWVLFLDTDCLIMNHTIELDSLIDENYSMIFENMGDRFLGENPEYENLMDWNYNPISSAMLFKNDEISKEFINNIYENKIVPVRGIYDNTAVRVLLNKNEYYKNKTKMFESDSRKLNSVWYTNKPSFLLQHEISWNDNKNIYKKGDFILHIVGYDIDERTSLAKQFLPYIIKDWS
jgi:glycosyltransferase involved in cell wall biosynthesis